MSNKMKIFLLVLVSIVVVIAGFFIYKKNQNKTNNPDNFSVTDNGAVNILIDNKKKQEFEQAIQKISQTDQDFDGIPDSEEAKYRTDPASIDTDGDGLTDSQEVNIYKSDPTKADTDGDKFNDGYEVRHGFSPKGAGKL